MFTLKRTDNGTDSTAGILLSPDGTRLCATPPTERDPGNKR